MRKLALAFVLAAVTLIAGPVSGSAQEPAPEVGMITLLEGDVGFSNELMDCQPGLAIAFMKMYEGDRYDLPPGSEMRLVYFSNGRQETWKGPAVFVVTPEGAEPEGDAGGPEVAELPAEVAGNMSELPENLEYPGMGRGGVSVMRGGCCDDEELEQAWNYYEELSKQTAPDDITPELYMLGVLSRLKRYNEMDQLVRVILAKQPDSIYSQGIEESFAQ